MPIFGGDFVRSFLDGCSDSNVSTFLLSKMYCSPTLNIVQLIYVYITKVQEQGYSLSHIRLLVKESLQMGVNFISLEATESGRPVYEKYGFVTLYTEMQLKNETYDTNLNRPHVLTKNSV